MLSASVVIKKLTRKAVVNQVAFDYLCLHMNERLPVRSIDFDFCPPPAPHGLFSITIDSPELKEQRIIILFVYDKDVAVEFELYVGGAKVWPKQ